MINEQYKSPYDTIMELAKECGINVLNNREEDYQEHLLRPIKEWGIINIKTNTIFTEDIINKFKEDIYDYIPVMYLIKINNKK
jgi:hypothetical protein